MNLIKTIAVIIGVTGMVLATLSKDFGVFVWALAYTVSITNWK